MKEAGAQAARPVMVDVEGREAVVWPLEPPQSKLRTAGGVSIVLASADLRERARGERRAIVDVIKGASNGRLDEPCGYAILDYEGRSGLAGTCAWRGRVRP